MIAERVRHGDATVSPLELIRAALIATCAEVTADDVMKIDRLTKASPRPELAEPRCGRTGR